jgi:hypothetical protein
VVGRVQRVDREARTVELTQPQQAQREGMNLEWYHTSYTLFRTWPVGQKDVRKCDGGQARGERLACLLGAGTDLEAGYGIDALDKLLPPDNRPHEGHRSVVPSKAQRP